MSLLKAKIEEIEIHTKAARAAIFEGLGKESLDFHLEQIAMAADFIKNRNKSRIVNKDNLCE